MSEWATRRQLEATHQEATIQIRTPTRKWDADDYLDAICAVVVTFSIVWLILDVWTCLNAYEALGPRIAVAYNPQCA